MAAGMLRISAERRIEERTDDNGYLRHKLRSGSMSRTPPRLEGVTESDITATTGRDLENRVPVPERAQTEPGQDRVKNG